MNTTPRLNCLTRLPVAAMLALALLITGSLTQCTQAEQVAPAEPADAPSLAKAIEVEKDAARIAGWELAFTDGFDREKLGAMWEGSDQWVIKDKQLHGRGVLISTKSFPSNGDIGFHRLAFDITPTDTDLKQSVRTLRAMIHTGSSATFGNIAHAQKSQNLKASRGYTLGFTTLAAPGNKGVTARSLIQPDAIVWEDKLNSPLLASGTHHVVLENDQNTLRVFVDGVMVFEKQQNASIMGQGYDHVAIQTDFNACVNEVRVYVKTLPNDLDLD